jgi:protein-S-isoprenylcysteine O-methyltransferase Ste14
VARLRVACGFLLLVAFAWLSEPSRLSMLIGLPIALLGLLLRGWASGHLAKDRQLATSGPYAYMRNPLYAGSIIIAFGFVIACRNLWLALISAALFLFVYFPAIELEEQHLRDLFPEYFPYAARVDRFLPLSRWSNGQSQFSWSLYLRNREYHAAIGFAIGVVWLLLKALRVIASPS